MATWMLALAGLAGIAHAVEFDEKLNAPMMKSPAEFKTQAQAFSKKYADIRAATPAQLITNASLAKQQFDLSWQVQHAINLKKPLDELAELGFVSRGDGSYNIDLDNHPEWDELTHALVAVTLPDNLDNTVTGLVQRGFRPEDVTILKSYLREHDFGTVLRTSDLTVSLGFARSVRKLDKAKTPVPDSLAFSYWYQRAFVQSEAERTWVEALLKSFDTQRQRILLSMVLEIKPTTLWAPDDITNAIPELLTRVRQPDFEQRARAEAEGVVP